jgi:hypothetical protein
LRGASGIGVALLALLTPGPVVAADPASEPLVAVVASSSLETSADGVLWRVARAGERIGAGKHVRVGAATSATLMLTGVQVLLSGAGRVTIQSDRLVLGAGRLELRTTLPVATAFPGGEMAGVGVAVVRCERTVVTVSVLDGEFEIRTGDRRLALVRGDGAIVRDGSPVEGPLALLAPPSAITPGSDPTYVRRGRPVQLSWTAEAGPHRVTVERRVGGGDRVREELVEASSVSVTLDELGLYRWRVARVDSRGLESPSSVDGYICIVER